MPTSVSTALARLAIPKSRTLAISPSSSRAKKMFSGFMSRCTIPAACALVSALATWVVMRDVSPHESRPNRSRR